MLYECDVSIDESRKNNFLSLKHKAEILERLEQGETASHLAREYGISKSTISRFKKRKEIIHKAVTTIYPNNTDRRTMRGTFHPKMEQALYKWYVEQCEQCVDVSTAMLRSQAQTFYNEFRESNYSFSASTGWIKNFKKRFGIERLNGDKQFEPSHKRTNTTSNINECSGDGGGDGGGGGGDGNGNDDINCESYEYLIETSPDFEDEKLTNQITCIIKPITTEVVPVNVEPIVDDAEAYRCLGTVIKWSIQQNVDSLYLTMLRNLKSKARNGKK